MKEARVFLNDLQDLFSHVPDGTRVHIGAARPPLAPGALASHTKHLFDR
jgi:hypothetical protein